MGKCVRRRVVPSAANPKNWKYFLRVDDNKTELFSFLSHQVTLLQIEGKPVYVTDGHDVLCSMAQLDLRGLVPSSHEEADTRLFLHVAEGLQDIAGTHSWHWRRRGGNSDAKQNKAWWIVGGVGYWWAFPVHSNPWSSWAIGPRKSATLQMLHALTGCDTVSSFAGIGKKTAWTAWNVYPEVTEAFEELMHMADPISDRTLEVVERFFVLMYSRTSDLSRVNDDRKQL